MLTELPFCIPPLVVGQSSNTASLRALARFLMWRVEAWKERPLDDALPTSSVWRLTNASRKKKSDVKKGACRRRTALAHATCCCCCRCCKHQVEVGSCSSEEGGKVFIPHNSWIPHKITECFLHHLFVQNCLPLKRVRLYMAAGESVSLSLVLGKWAEGDEGGRVTVVGCAEGWDWGGGTNKPSSSLFWGGVGVVDWGGVGMTNKFPWGSTCLGDRAKALRNVFASQSNVFSFIGERKSPPPA